ncbi:glycosyltransferase [Candidatus Peregrinibacteria bacterium]|nr:glycosyltransferase [Candidatus Peregrinibacteria bacterium]
MKNIVFYTDTPIYGGAERHMLLLAKNINPNKYTVQLVCSNYKALDPWCKLWKENGFKVHRIKVIHKHDPRTLLRIKKLFRELNPAIAHLHLWNPGSCRYAFSAIDKSKTKIIVTEHDPFPLSGIKKSLKTRTLKKIDHIITVSNANKDLMLKLYPEVKPKISTIHNGINIEQFESQLIHFPIQERNRIKSHIFAARPDEFIILTIAELHPRKGLLYLIEAFKHVHEKSPNTRLVITGEGPQRKILEKFIKNLKLSDNITLTGKQSDIAKILRSSDLFVLPSVKEAFGMVLLEAMAAQVPIVATEVGGIPEIIQHKKTGVLVAPKDFNALAEAITELINNQAQRQKYTYMGHHHVQNFDAKKMGEKTEKIYDLLLK